MLRSNKKEGRESFSMTRQRRVSLRDLYAMVSASVTEYGISSTTHWGWRELLDDDLWLQRGMLRSSFASSPGIKFYSAFPRSLPQILPIEILRNINTEVLTNYLRLIMPLVDSFVCYCTPKDTAAGVVLRWLANTCYQEQCGWIATCVYCNGEQWWSLLNTAGKTEPTTRWWLAYWGRCTCSSWRR